MGHEPFIIIMVGSGLAIAASRIRRWRSGKRAE
jgi:hypothetical protein